MKNKVLTIIFVLSIFSCKNMLLEDNEKYKDYQEAKEEREDTYNRYYGEYRHYVDACMSQGNYVNIMPFDVWVKINTDYYG